VRSTSSLAATATRTVVRSIAGVPDAGVRIRTSGGKSGITGGYVVRFL
jgi:hypothetical protein